MRQVFETEDKLIFESEEEAALHERLLKATNGNGKHYGEAVRNLFTMFRYRPLEEGQWAVLAKERTNGTDVERFKGVYEGRLADVIFLAVSHGHLVNGGSIFSSPVRAVAHQPPS